MLRVYLLRHGETQYNADGNRYCGRTDIGLTPKGLAQAKQVYDLLKDEKIDAVYSSPLIRARTTADIATGGFVNVDNRLIEIDFGKWDGKTREEFIDEDPMCWQKWVENPELAEAGGIGESGSKVVSRMDSFFDDMLIKHLNKTIVVVAHNGVNRLYMAHKLGMPLENYRRILQENSSITMFDLDEVGVFTLVKLNAG
jgi:broad specificity phosphatase PhoE